MHLFFLRGSYDRAAFGPACRRESLGASPPGLPFPPKEFLARCAKITLTVRLQQTIRNRRRSALKPGANRISENLSHT